LCCFSTSNTKGKRMFRYRLSPETFGYTFVYLHSLNTFPWRGTNLRTWIIFPLTSIFIFIFITSYGMSHYWKEWIWRKQHILSPLIPKCHLILSRRNMWMEVADLYYAFIFILAKKTQTNPSSWLRTVYRCVNNTAVRTIMLCCYAIITYCNFPVIRGSSRRSNR